MDTAEHRSMLWDMYVIYSNHGPDSPPLSYEDWYNDYYLVDVWVSASHAVGCSVFDFDVEYPEDVKMPYDRHDAVLVAQAFQNLPKNGWVLDCEDIDNIDIKEQ